MYQTTVYIKGMHCRACELLVEEELQELPGVTRIVARQRRGTADIFHEAETIDPRAVSRAVRAAGYQLGKDDPKPLISTNPDDYRDLGIALIVAAVLGLVGNQLGLFDIKSANDNLASLPVVFLVGLTAGLSTCMALVGGLVLGVSARFAEDRPDSTAAEKFRPHLFFNLGRIAGFTLLGGVIGMLGSVFQASTFMSGVLIVLVGLVMLTMGLQLTGIFPRLSKLSLAMPTTLGRLLGVQERRDREYSHTNAMLLGALTFFVPCGFTQLTQLYAMSTGSFVAGAATMGVFALGTAPGLLSVGGLTAVVRGAAARTFFKFAGVVVIFMALFNISNGYNLTGWDLPSMFGGSQSVAAAAAVPQTAGQPAAQSKAGNKGGQAGAPASAAPKAAAPQAAPPAGNVQVIKTTYTLNEDIVPNQFTVKAGVPVRMEIDVKENGQGCMSTIMIPGLANKPVYLRKGQPIVFNFTPTQKRSYQITCAMGVPRGTLTVQ